MSIRFHVFWQGRNLYHNNYIRFFDIIQCPMKYFLQYGRLMAIHTFVARSMQPLKSFLLPSSEYAAYNFLLSSWHHLVAFLSIWTFEVCIPRSEDIFVNGMVTVNLPFPIYQFSGPVKEHLGSGITFQPYFRKWYDKYFSLSPNRHLNCTQNIAYCNVPFKNWPTGKNLT